MSPYFSQKNTRSPFSFITVNRLPTQTGLTFGSIFRHGPGAPALSLQAPPSSPHLPHAQVGHSLAVPLCVSFRRKEAFPRSPLADSCPLTSLPGTVSRAQVWDGRDRDIGKSGALREGGARPVTLLVRVGKASPSFLLLLTALDVGWRPWLLCWPLSGLSVIL